MNLSSWPTVFLGDICDIVAGGTPSRKNPNYFKGNIPWVKIGDMRQGVITNTEESISQAGIDNSAAKILPAGTVLISIFATIGRTAVLGIDAATNQAIAGVIPKANVKINKAFLRYSLDNSVMELIKAARGVAQININGKILKSLRVPLPPLSEQERIVKLLDEAEALRTLRASTRMADFVPALFEEMFGNPIHHKQSIISSVAKVQGGLQLTPKRNNYKLRKPYLRVANVQRNHLILDEIKEISLTEEEFNRTRLEDGDILIVEGNGNPEEIGRAAIWNAQIVDCVHQNHLIRVRCDRKELLPEYLVIFLNNENGRRYFLKSGNTTSGLVTISTSIVKNCSIPIPSIALQQEFASKVKEARAIQAVQTQSEERIEALYQSMLSRAFTGQL